jgi:hypothetical protein
VKEPKPREEIMPLELEFVSATLKWSTGPYIVSERGNDNVSFGGEVTRLVGNTLGDHEVWQKASWWLEFRPGAEFAVEVRAPTPPKGPRDDPGDSGSVSVTLPMGLLPAFFDLLGPNGDRPVHMEITPRKAEFMSGV